MSEQAEKPKRHTAKERAKSERIKRLAFRLVIAREYVGQVWRDADYDGAVDKLREIERSIEMEAQRLLESA
jgi:hypothetical protein